MSVPVHLRTPFVWDGKQAVIDENLVDHVWETLGILPGVFRAWIDIAYPPQSGGRRLLEMRAYDFSHGTRCAPVVEIVELPDFAWESYQGRPHVIRFTGAHA